MIMSISYNIVEVNKDTECDVDIDKLMDDVNNQYKEKDAPLKSYDGGSSYYDFSKIAALELDYQTNYTVKMLKHIMDYYHIYKRKVLKQEMIDLIVAFEENPENYELVERRSILWQNIKEMKADDYLCKFIFFDC